MGSAGYKEIGPDTVEILGSEIVDMKTIFVISDDTLNVTPFPERDSHLYLIHFFRAKACVDMAIVNSSFSIDCFN